MPAQTFFIPKKISGLRLSKLPLTAPLLAVLKKLNVETFGDLSGMAIRDFQRVSNRGAALFAEMNGLTQRARNGDFAAIFGQSGGLLNLTSGQKPRVIMSGESAAEKDGKFSTTQLCALPSETSTDERIYGKATGLARGGEHAKQRWKHHHWQHARQYACAHGIIIRIGF